MTRNLKSPIYGWKGLIAIGLFHPVLFSIGINMRFTYYPISMLLGALRLLVH
jgi:hypothetical protein